MKCSRCKRDVDDSRSKSLCRVCLESGKIRSKKSRIKTGFSQRRKELGLQAVSKGLCKFCFRNPIYTSHSKICCEHCFYKRKEANTSYKKSHRQEEIARSRLWGINNPEKLKASIKNYIKNNKDKVYQNRHNRRVRLKGAVGEVTYQEWINIKNKFGNICLWCKRKNIELTRDHVVPLVRGGTNMASNIQPLCASCNSKKHTKILDFRPFGPAILEWT